MGRESIKVEMVKDVLPKFEAFLQAEGHRYEKERLEKDKFFSEHFSKVAINKLEEGTLRELIRKLWAFGGWTNKDYLLEEMLKSGLDNIKEAFQILLYSKKPISVRFDYAKENIRILGAAAISEILIHLNKESYPIWNRRAREGLIYLGIPVDELPKSSQINGSQYEDYCELMNSVLDSVRKYSSQIDDLFSLDFLLFFISSEELEKEAQTPVKEKLSIDDFEHDAVIDQILELGDGLGFEVEKELSIAHGCRIDALWRSRVANLGTISYAFEVHRRGSRDSAILNLQRVVKQDATIQKVILVSSTDELKSFKQDISTLGEDFRNAIGYFEVDDLQVALRHLESLKNILENLGLLSMKRVF